VKNDRRFRLSEARFEKSRPLHRGTSSAVRLSLQYFFEGAALYGRHIYQLLHQARMSQHHRDGLAPETGLLDCSRSNVSKLRRRRFPPWAEGLPKCLRLRHDGQPRPGLAIKASSR